MPGLCSSMQIVALLTDTCQSLISLIVQCSSWCRPSEEHYVDIEQGSIRQGREARVETTITAPTPHPLPAWGTAPKVEKTETRIGKRTDKDSHTGTAHVEVVEPPNGSTQPETNELDRTTATRGREAAERFFYDKGDLCSEVEVIKDCEVLNGRVETLVFALQDDWQAQGCTGTSGSESMQGATVQTISDVDGELQKALGEQLIGILKKLSVDDQERHGYLQDALQAWIVYSLHEAMLHTLFGTGHRTAEDLSLIHSSMQWKEPELAECWLKILLDHAPEELSLRHHAPQPDQQTEYFTIVKGEVGDLLDETFKDLRVKAAQETDVSARSMALALHWRQLAHSFETKLDSRLRSMHSTQEKLVNGLSRLYTIWYPKGQTLVAVRDGVQETVKKTRVLEEAAKLAEKIVCGFFSRYLVFAVIKPGDAFDSRLMVCSDASQMSGINEATCRVSLTTDLGIYDLTTHNNPRVLLKPKVLLAVSEPP